MYSEITFLVSVKVPGEITKHRFPKRARNRFHHGTIVGPSNPEAVKGEQRADNDTRERTRRNRRSTSSRLTSRDTVNHDIRISVRRTDADLGAHTVVSSLSYT